MKARVKSLCLLAASASLACLLPIAQAAAQQAGAYRGHTADGNAISFDVVGDSQGHLALSDLAIQFTAGCGQTGSSITQSWHFFFPTGLPIEHGHVRHLENNPQLYLMNSLNFHGDRVNGTTEARLPMLVPGKPSQTAQLCASGKQAFEATFQSPEGSSPFDHPGTARLKSPERTAILEWSSDGVTHQELRKQP
ncbi:MAG TPA: hypothetical protein VHW69_07835 [Rhizomicrobium sp.]|nr:hypothetical protein [Rhizomicrobium sp.]